MAETPLYTALKAHADLHRASFHTPGHKNSEAMRFFNFFDLDFTELPDTDSLYEASGAIKKAEDRMSGLYGTQQTLFSAGGCTLCIQTMLKLALPYGGKIVASRMIHKSAVNTMALLNADVRWVMPKVDEHSGLFLQVEPADIETILAQEPDITCVYITNPDYFGHIADITGISRVCKRHNVPLLVDNAHGAHLKFLPEDLHPITLGADLVADSAHKTLPVLTGGALLHIADAKFAPCARAAMSIFGSTSPSYPIMASLDVCQSWLCNNGKTAFFALQKEISKIKKIAAQKGILDDCANVDPVRLTLDVAKIGLSGDSAAEYFRQNGIEPELSTAERVVFIATPMNSPKDFERLAMAIKNLQPAGTALPVMCPAFELPIVKKSLHSALFSPSEHINSCNSAGRVSAGTVCPCPPGIPILVPGELITEISVKNLLRYGIFLIDVIK